MNIDGLVQKFYDTVKSHELAQGGYARWLWQHPNGKGEPRDLGVSEYGCADAANILYTIGRFPRDLAERQAFVSTLQQMQNPNTGLFHEPTHRAYHSTAHCIAALELFDASPLYPTYELEQYLEKDRLISLLDDPEWATNPWDQSHLGAGVAAALMITNRASQEWQDWYFGWLDNEADPETGLWRKGYAGKEGNAPLYYYLGGSFHYAFIYDYARWAFPYPDKLIDTMLKMYKEHTIGGEHFNRGLGFLQIDWAYLLTRASRQTGHRHDEVQSTLIDFANEFIPWMDSINEKTSDGFNDLHVLFGSVCCVAELQTALPGLIRSTTPLKIVLDRRPFI